MDDAGEPLTFASCEISVIGGPDRGRSFTSEKPLIRIGAASDNDLVLRDEAVSRHHLEVETRKGEYVVNDVGSTNGTFSGALQVTRATLRGVTELRAGNDVLRFVPRQHREHVTPSLSRRCVDLVGGSAVMRDVFGLIERVAPTDLPVLISGETGTGKELGARAVHALSRRADRPFVTLDCSSLPPTLIESALFGYERGAFTGADRSYAGVFERAHGGTLFLDELGELPIELQPKLLRAVERGEIERLRGESAVRVDVRLVAATNRAVEEMVAAGGFRADLYYRLAVVSVRLPPLRDRMSDLPLLVESMLAQVAPARRFDSDAMAAISRYPFPGNVRELANLVRRAAVLAPNDVIGLGDLPPLAVPLPVDRPAAAEWTGLSFKDAKSRLVDHFEREYLQDVLQRHGFNVSSAAREARIGRRHFHRLLDKYGIATRRDS